MRPGRDADHSPHSREEDEESYTSAPFWATTGPVTGLLCSYIYLKGKAIPLQAWTGLEGSRRLRLPDFKTTDT